MKNSEILVNMLDNKERAKKLSELVFNILDKMAETDKGINNIEIIDMTKDWLDADGGDYSITEKFKEMQGK